MFFSCSPKVLYDDPRKVETLTINFSSTDLQIISQAMVDSLLQSVITNNDNKPIIVIEEVKIRQPNISIPLLLLIASEQNYLTVVCTIWS